MHVFKPRPLKLVALMIGLAASLVSTVLVVSGTIVLFVDNSMRNMKEYASYMSESLAAIAIDPMLNEAYISLEGAVETFRGRQDVESAFVSDKSGRIVASLQVELLDSSIDELKSQAGYFMGSCEIPDKADPGLHSRLSFFEQTKLLSANTMEWRWPIEYAGASLGCAVIVVSLDSVRERISSILYFGFGSGIVAFISASAIALLLAIGVSRPVESLAIVAGRIANGEMPHVPPQIRIRELSRLAETMMEMGKTIEAKRIALESARDRANASRDKLQANSIKLAAALDEKMVLLKEIHHRVKNNLQIITSLLHLQMENMYDSRDSMALAQGQARIQSMALVHDLLYRSDNLSRIDLKEYIETFCRDTAETCSGTMDIRIETELMPVSVNIEYAIPLGLILNELITNSIKHAFPGGRKGIIHVGLAIDEECSREAEDCHDVSITVSDDGVGSKTEASGGNGLGLTLIDALVKQIRASASWDVSEGTSFTMHFACQNVEEHMCMN